MSRWLVPLPGGARPPIRVFVNGVPQREGEDFVVEAAGAVFSKPLRKERLGFWRWTLMFFSIAGSYGSDYVDVHYRDARGRERVATNVEVVGPD